MKFVYDDGQVDIHLSKEEVSKLSKSLSKSMSEMILKQLPPELKEQFQAIIGKMAKPADDLFACPYCTASFDSADGRLKHVGSDHPRKL